MIRIGCVVGVLVGLLSQPAGADWTVKRDTEQTGRAARCVLVADTLTVPDGYLETQASMIVSADAIIVKTKAPLDDSFADIGLQVDKNNFIAMDKLVQERSALFASSYASILEQFQKASAPVKKGQKPTTPTVRVQLRFWPTWPATGTHNVEFPLTNFGKAYADMLACKPGR